MTAVRHPQRPRPTVRTPFAPGEDTTTTRADASTWLDTEHESLLGLADAMLTGGAPLDWQLVYAVAMASADREESARAIELTRTALPLVDPDDPEAGAFLDIVMARAYGMSSRYAEALVPLGRLRARPRRPGTAGIAVWAHELTGLVLDSTGEQDAAAQQYEAALELARREGLPQMEWSILHNVVDLELERGHLDVAVALLDRQAGVAVDRGDPKHRLLPAAHLGTVAWLAGDHARALELLAPLCDDLLGVQAVRAACEALLVQAHAAVALGRRDVADAVATRALEVAVGQEDGPVFGRVLAAVAVVEARWDDVDHGLDGLRHALAITRATGSTATTLEVLLAHGVSTLVAARPGPVRAAALEALALADAAGNALAAARARELVAATDAVPVPGP